MDTQPNRTKPLRIPAATVLACRELLRPYLPEVEAGDILARLTAKAPDTAGARPAEPERGRLLNVRQAAERLACSRSVVFALLRQNRLSRVKLGARSTRIPEDSVAALAERGGVA